MRYRLIGMSILGLGFFLIVSSGRGFSSERIPDSPGAQSLQKGNMEQTIDPGREGEEMDPEQLPSGIAPPVHDPEMVIHPEVPADPDAVVTPPVVDPEMAVDPATRQPMTKEKLDNLKLPDQLHEGSLHKK